MPRKAKQPEHVHGPYGREPETGAILCTTCGVQTSQVLTYAAALERAQHQIRRAKEEFAEARAKFLEEFTGGAFWAVRSAIEWKAVPLMAQEAAVEILLELERRLAGVLTREANESMRTWSDKSRAEAALAVLKALGDKCADSALSNVEWDSSTSATANQRRKAEASANAEFARHGARWYGFLFDQVIEDAGLPAIVRAAGPVAEENVAEENVDISKRHHAVVCAVCGREYQP